MNTQQLRQTLKLKWLDYYRENRPWLTRVRVWVNLDGVRRPSSGFILATLSALEPDLNQLLPLVVDLSADPDRIIKALGLNFNPDEALKAIAPSADSDDSRKMLPQAKADSFDPIRVARSRVTAKADETCHGVGRTEAEASPE